MNLLTSIEKLLRFLNDNWTTIIIIISLIIALVKKTISWINKSEEEKIEIALKIAKEYIIKWVTEAELDYSEWTKSGSIKRAEVIAKVYETFPILKKFVDQDKLIELMDTYINEALEELKHILDENASTDTEEIDD